MSEGGPDLSGLLTAILNSIVSFVTALVNAISANLTTFATLAVIGLVVFAIVRFGRRIFSGIRGFLEDLIPF